MPSILVVENEPNARESIAETLRETYFTVDVARNTTDALLKAQSGKHELIICDEGTLHLNGVELLELVRADPRTRVTPFILIAARYDKDAMRRSMNQGADDYLIRPLTTDDLLESVVARLNRFQAIFEAAEVRLDMTKRSIARLLTHELRTPLISMNTAIEILSRETGMFSPEETRDLLQSLAAGGTRLGHRIEQLTFMTQVQTHSMTRKTIAKQGIEARLSDLVMTSINLAHRLTRIDADAHSIKQGDAAPNALVICNPHALKQALAELIANALMYSPHDAPIYIGQKYVEEGVRITITDQGAGMSDERLAQAMESFTQLDRDTNEQQGLGIGLPLAQRLIDVHGGMLEVRCIVGEGTQVLIYLPLAPHASKQRAGQNPEQGGQSRWGQTQLLPALESIRAHNERQVQSTS
ncbi:MAG: hybrid sensor histidine kinase/response regulator [Chloroflexota bacterium]|nr:hybrid sensor histidine kinase/response regulator [Chloroflexota bacterium]